MFNLILMWGSFGLFMASFICLIIDLLSKKRNQNRSPDKKLPKLSRNSLFLSLISLILLVFVSLTYNF